MMKLFIFALVLFSNTAVAINDSECGVLAQSIQRQQQRLSAFEVAPERLRIWLNQFDLKDRKIALEIIRGLYLINFSELSKNLKATHSKLVSQLIADGFVNTLGGADLERIDFSRAYTAKSGDLISFFYRKANLILNSKFHSSDQLSTLKTFSENSNRALVILDDYVGTGAQFLSEFYGRNYAKIFNTYAKVYLVVITAHQKATERFDQIKQGENAAVAEAFINDFQLIGNEVEATRASLNNVKSDKIELIYRNIEFPMLADENPHLSATEKLRIKDFLLKYGDFDQNPFAPFGVANLQGSTVFFYGPPNSLPDILWNSLGRYKKNPLIPLFARVEDISHYDFAKGLPPGQQIWGGK